MGGPTAPIAVLLIHGFGANTNHWRFNQPVLAELAPTYAIDLLGFGRSDQPRARLKQEPLDDSAVHYGFDLWGQQVADFCREVIDKPVVLVGNSIGGVVALPQARTNGSIIPRTFQLHQSEQRGWRLLSYSPKKWFVSLREPS